MGGDTAGGAVGQAAGKAAGGAGGAVGQAAGEADGGAVGQAAGEADGNAIDETARKSMKGRISNKILYTLASGFLALVVLGALLWMFHMAPVYTEREREARNENAVMGKDIAEIEAMGGTTEALDEKIRNAESRIDKNYQNRSVTDNDAASLIEGICARAGVVEPGIVIGERTMLSPSGTYTPALYTAEATLLFEGTEKTGAGVIRGLENSAAADFAVTAFIFRVIPPGEEDGTDGGVGSGGEKKPGTDDGSAEGEAESASPIGEWVITASLYYYE